jgi:hypothetical protein
VHDKFKLTLKVQITPVASSAILQDFQVFVLDKDMNIASLVQISC